MLAERMHASYFTGRGNSQFIEAMCLSNIINYVNSTAGSQRYVFGHLAPSYLLFQVLTCCFLNGSVLCKTLEEKFGWNNLRWRSTVSHCAPMWRRGIFSWCSEMKRINFKAYHQHCFHWVPWFPYFSHGFCMSFIHVLVECWKSLEMSFWNIYHCLCLVLLYSLFHKPTSPLLGTQQTFWGKTFLGSNM